MPQAHEEANEMYDDDPNKYQQENEWKRSSGSDWPDLGRRIVSDGLAECLQ